MHMLSCQTDEGTWALSYVTLPSATLVGAGLQHLAASLARNLGAAAQMGGSLPGQGVTQTALGPIQVPGMTADPHAQGWRFRGQRPDGLGRPLEMDVRAWHFSHGLTVFQATAWLPDVVVKAQSGEDVAEPFFHGLQFPG